MTKDEYEKEQKRVLDFQEVWAEIGIFEDALAEVEGERYTLSSLAICIRDYGIQMAIQKILEERIKELREELEKI